MSWMQRAPGTASPAPGLLKYLLALKIPWEKGQGNRDGGQRGREGAARLRDNGITVWVHGIGGWFGLEGVSGLSGWGRDISHCPRRPQTHSSPAWNTPRDVFRPGLLTVGCSFPTWHTDNGSSSRPQLLQEFLPVVNDGKDGSHESRGFPGLFYALSLMGQVWEGHKKGRAGAGNKDHGDEPSCSSSAGIQAREWQRRFQA